MKLELLMKQLTIGAVLALLFVVVVSASATQKSGSPDNASGKVEMSREANGVVSVPAYPIVWPEMPNGPSKDVYLANCVTCHSQLYVLMQPPFPRKTWTAEVEKMKKSYGAQIEDAV